MSEANHHLGQAPIPRVEELLAHMTLREKLGQMTQHAFGSGDPEQVRERV